MLTAPKTRRPHAFLLLREQVRFRGITCRSPSAQLGALLRDAERAVAAFVPADKQDAILMLLRLDRALLELFAVRGRNSQGQGRLLMTPAIEDFAAIKARLDELRREREQQQPSPDTDTGGPAAPNPEPVYDCA